MFLVVQCKNNKRVADIQKTTFSLTLNQYTSTKLFIQRINNIIVYIIGKLPICVRGGRGIKNFQ